MTTDEKLAAILAAVQTDPGNRGLARDPHDNLFTATAGQFEAACRSIAEHPDPGVLIYTGFWIPNATPPAFETDGPLGAAFVSSGFLDLGIRCDLIGGFIIEGLLREWFQYDNWSPTHLLSIEFPGPTADGTLRTMRGIDITDRHSDSYTMYEGDVTTGVVTIGIGDGGNEIGMGNINPATIGANIVNGATVHCRVTTDHLIVAGVSNWGAYALVAGVAVLRGKPEQVARHFDSQRELKHLEKLVETGELVDGVVGKVQATVDGLPWDVYAAPLVRIREILELP